MSKDKIYPLICIECTCAIQGSIMSARPGTAYCEKRKEQVPDSTAKTCKIQDRGEKKNICFDPEYCNRRGVDNNVCHVGINPEKSKICLIGSRTQGDCDFAYRYEFLYQMRREGRAGAYLKQIEIKKLEKEMSTKKGKIKDLETEVSDAELSISGLREEILA